MSRRLHAFRIIAAAFAALFVLAPVASSLHADEHAHVYCAEHQVIEESGRAPSPAAFDLTQSASLPFDFGQGERFVASSESHQSCAFLALAVRQAIASETERGDQLRVTFVADALTPRSRGHDVVAVLFEAPKASPPLA